MLICAIPKSSSTSMMQTLGELHGLSFDQDNNNVRFLPKSEEFMFVHRYHGCMRELNVEFVDKWTNGNMIWKNHVLPTKNNLALLDDKKKVILLRRDIMQIILAYKRAEHTNIHRRRREFRGCRTDQEWINRAIEIGLYSDLVKFNDKWLSHEGDKLVVYYEDVMDDQQREVNRIEGYFGLSISDNVEYAKRRWSRGGKVKSRPA